MIMKRARKFAEYTLERMADFISTIYTAIDDACNSYLFKSKTRLKKHDSVLLNDISKDFFYTIEHWLSPILYPKKKNNH